jgi:hypothetical protein
VGRDTALRAFCGAKSAGWLVLILLLGTASVSEARFEGVARAGDWTVYRDNVARPFENFATPLVIGTFDRNGAGALAVQCRPDTGVFAPTRYSISGGFLFLNFAPDPRRLLGSPWRTAVSLGVDGAGSHTPYALRLPFVSGFILEKLAADVDALYDEAETVLLVPLWTLQSMEQDLRRGRDLVARIYDNGGRRVELRFSLDGYATARDALEAACTRLNDRHAG